MEFEDQMQTQEKHKYVWDVVGQARIAAVTLGTGEANHGHVVLWGRKLQRGSWSGYSKPCIFV